MDTFTHAKPLARADHRSALFLLLLAANACGADDMAMDAPGASGASGAAGVAGSGGRETDAEPPDSGAANDAGICAAAGSRFVTGIVAYAFGLGQNVGQDRFPDPIFGPPRGLGCCQGSTADVVSLGNGGTVTVEFSDNAIVDGPGPDFIVFENAFWSGGDPNAVFAELATVEASADGIEWREFPCAAVAPPYESCAGWHPVYANADTNSIDPLDADAAGGDPFDLAVIGLTLARFVRITDREDLIGLSGVFDLDAVGIVHALCP
jgi:hypothetical protein